MSSSTVDYGWSKEAAEEAERVAAITFSRHGNAFLDGAWNGGNGTVCECYAYAWLRCNRVEDTDCYAVLKSAGIIGRAGSLFGEGELGKSYAF
ncbi:hypothetical protein V2J09_024196 [Rumex salicifolius]